MGRQFHGKTFLPKSGVGTNLVFLKSTMTKRSLRNVSHEITTLVGTKRSAHESGPCSNFLDVFKMFLSVLLVGLAEKTKL